MSESNPWLSVRAVATDAGPAAPTPDPRQAVAATGPTAPQTGIAVPDLVDQLPFRDHAAAADLWWVGVHGGAGESTLGRLVPGWSAAGHAWPRTTPSYSMTRVVLVARSHAAGLQAAQKAATQWAAGAVPLTELLGLVIVADAPGRLPRPLRDLAALVSGGVPRTWHLPWIESWRLGEDPHLESSPREVRHLARDLTALLPPHGSATGANR
jgi:hypothetical protein